MVSNLTKEQIEMARYIMSLAEPYETEEEYQNNSYYDDTNEGRIKRCDATEARDFLREHGIDV